MTGRQDMNVPDSKEDRAEEFVHIVSHDLKEPLRSMRNFSQILLEDYGDSLNQEAQDYLEIITRCVARMQRQIESLAHYACTGQCGFTPARLSLPLAVQDTQEALALLIAEKEADVRCMAEDEASLFIDRACLVEILANLVQNAIKYNENAVPVIEIGLLPPGEAREAAEKAAVVYVRDNGIGIRPEHYGVIFKIFRRLHPADHYGGGTGNGLAIVQRLVSQYGGRIWVESVEGRGSTFFFTVPMADERDAS